eukprot:TRINITY_DN2099_c0_g1_i2.p1 TRINITY_DN2099_c0_g1~~TRINITY_DN2099_c0_g1_i2.p1  ORF type:complete len:228 (-),score=56.97 TRINITY_DN2099_c0_g1_i2:76-738(-)
MSTSCEWSSSWSKKELCPGPGVIIEGTIKTVRMHSVFLRSAPSVHSQEEQLPTRYIALIVDVDMACRRNFDANGNEKPPKMSKMKMATKGYLPHWDRVDSSLVEKLTIDELSTTLAGSPACAVPPGWSDTSAKKVHPTVPNAVEVWMEADKYKHMDLKVGEAVRIKTSGNSIIGESLARMGEQHVPTVGGDPKLGQSWTSKIVANKEEEPEEEEDNGEWD